MNLLQKKIDQIDHKLFAEVTCVCHEPAQLTVSKGFVFRFKLRCLDFSKIRVGKGFNVKVKVARQLVHIKKL